MAIAVLDASVVIALFDDRDVHHESAVNEVGQHADHRRVLPATAYAECLVRPLQRGGEAARTIDRAISEHALEVVAIDASIARRAAELRAVHAALTLPDAIVLATGDSLDADVVLTADDRWRRYGARVRVI